MRKGKEKTAVYKKDKEKKKKEICPPCGKKKERNRFVS